MPMVCELREKNFIRLESGREMRGNDAVAKFPSESFRSAHLAYAALLVTLFLYDHEALRRSF